MRVNLQRLIKKFISLTEPLMVRIKTNHIFGPAALPLEKDDVVIICLVKNGGFYLKKFVDYHLSIGINHFIFIDNGSEDNTLAIAKEYNQVTIVTSNLSAKQYESHLRNYAAKKYANNHWCLVIDVDEIFDFPHSDFISLKQFIHYLNHNSYTATVTQMLDMFPKKYQAINSKIGSDYTKEHNYYSLSNIEKIDYKSRNNPFFSLIKENSIVNPDIKYFFGGIRKKVFGTNNCLTKHSLVLCSSDNIVSSHPHCSSRVNCADVTALIKHYKFSGDFFNKIKKQIKNKTWGHGEDEKYMEKMKNDPLEFYEKNDSLLFNNIPTLIEKKFLVTSKQFETYVASLAKTQKTE